MTVGVEVVVRVPPAAFKHVLYHSVPGPLLDMAFGLLKSNYVMAAIALGLWPVVLIFTALSYARHQGRKLQWKICRCGYFSGRIERRVSAYMFLWPQGGARGLVRCSSFGRSVLGGIEADFCN